MSARPVAVSTTLLQAQPRWALLVLAGIGVLRTAAQVIVTQIIRLRAQRLGYPDHMGLKCCETPYGVDVSAAELPSPIQQAALDALRDRWPET